MEEIPFPGFSVTLLCGYKMRTSQPNNKGSLTFSIHHSIIHCIVFTVLSVREVKKHDVAELWQPGL